MYLYFGVGYLGRDWTEPKKAAESLVSMVKAGGIGPSGVLASKDRRLKAFVGNIDDNNMDKAREFFFDSQEQWQHVLDVKRKSDPQDIFTANLFCIGASASLDDKTQFENVDMENVDSKMLTMKMSTLGKCRQ